MFWAPAGGPDAAAYQQLRGRAINNDVVVIEEALQSDLDVTRCLWMTEKV